MGLRANQLIKVRDGTIYQLIMSHGQVSIMKNVEDTAKPYAVTVGLRREAHNFYTWDHAEFFAEAGKAAERFNEL